MIAEQHTIRRWCPLTPTPQQAKFLAATEREVLFGPAVGGGKTTALLMAALQYVDTPGYSALILRRRYNQLTYPGGIVERLRQSLFSTEAFWRAIDHSWHFPSGARLRVDYAATVPDIYQYAGEEYHFIGLDEAEDFTERQYLFLLGRLRRYYNVPLPLRMRLTMSEREPEPGEPPSWVQQRFLLTPQPGTAVVRCSFADNPHLSAATVAALRDREG